MDKYTLLLILNLPFVIFGYLKAFMMYQEGILRRGGLILRIVFWTIIILGFVFAQKIYNYLSDNNLTDSPPLSLADVILVTGVVFCLFLTIRMYSKIDKLEKKISDLHEELSIREST